MPSRLPAGILIARSRRRSEPRNSVKAVFSEVPCNPDQTTQVRLASNSKDASNMKDVGTVRVSFTIFKTRRHISTLNVKAYNCMDLEDRCPICLEDFSEENAKDVCSLVKVDPTSQTTIIQSCPHMMCKKCVANVCKDAVLKKEVPKCPCCRQQFVGSIQFDFADKRKKMVCMRHVSFLGVPMLRTLSWHFLDLVTMKSCNCRSACCKFRTLGKLLLLESPYMTERDTDFKIDDPNVIGAQNFYALSAFALSDTNEITPEWKNFRVTSLRSKLTSYKRNKRKWNKTYPIPFEAIFPSTDLKMMALFEKLKEYDQRSTESMQTIDLL